jgi:hypothetical protein
VDRPVISAGAAVAFSALAGVAVVAMEQWGPALLLVAILLAAAGLVAMHTGASSRWHNPVATLLVAASVLCVAFQGVQGPVSVPVSDLPFLLAVPLIGLALLRRQLPLLVPGWLVLVAGGLAVGALLGALFVTNPPDFVIGPGDPAAAVAQRQTSLALFLRTIYALVLVPVLIAAVASSWFRTRLFADLWLASTAICALVACLDQIAHTGISASLVSTGELFERAIGLTDQPNYLGQFTAMALPLGIVRTYQARGLGSLAALTATGLLVLALELSGSRSGLFGAVVGVVALALLAPRVRPGIVVGGVALVVLGAASIVYQPSGLSVLERLSGGDPTAGQAENAREVVLERSFDIAADHPLTGVGFSRILDSHSLPIQFLMAGGLIALMAFLLWVWRMAALGIALARSSRAPPVNAEIAAALTAALAAWLIPGIFNPQLLERFMYVPAGLLLAMAYCLRSQPSAKPAEGATADRRPERAPSRLPVAA